MATIGSNAAVAGTSFYVTDSTENIGNAIKRISNSSTSSSSSENNQVQFSRLAQARAATDRAEQELKAEDRRVRDLEQALEAARRTREQLQQRRNEAQQAQANISQESARSALSETFDNQDTSTV